MADGVELKLNTQLAAQLHTAVVNAVTDTFTGEMKTEAKSLSPVGTPPEDRHPGQNRDSIDATVIDDASDHSIRATLYTQSGYGFYLEHGTAKRDKRGKRIRAKKGKFKPDRTAPRPHIYPAFQLHVAKIAQRVKEYLRKPN
jgi:hypothetical protein